MLKILMQLQRLLIKTASLLLITGSVAAAAAVDEQIGVVLATNGQVQARNATGVVRDLQRRSAIYVFDTILTGPEGQAQFRMVDDARFSLQANSRFTFNQYFFDGDAATADSAVMSLLSGGFRTISGAAGKARQDDYRIDTPFASIGLCGASTHEAIISERLYTGVSSGSTTVSKASGSLLLGLGSWFNYSETVMGAAPAGLLDEPAELNEYGVASQGVIGYAGTFADPAPDRCP